MTIDASKSESNRETQFYEFLIRKADEYGFAEPKKSGWVHYMLDTSRGKKIVEFLISYFDINDREDVRVLDVGCGFGGLLTAFKRYFDHVSGIEIVEERVLWAKKRALGSEVICGCATKLPWPDGWFGLVTSTDVFEHVSYRQQELIASEIKRVLKPGGNAFVSVPNRLQLFDEHNYVYFGTWMPSPLREKYVRGFSKNESFVQCWERTGRGWRSLFEEKGFKVALKPVKTMRIAPPSRYEIYLTR